MNSIVNYSRRRFIRIQMGGAISAALLWKCANAALVADKVIAGAIRWDAWYSPKDQSVFAQRTLSNEEYRHRAPAHCAKAPVATPLQCVGSQAVIDDEIRDAARAGLSYWAFCWYGASTSFREAWNLYQASTQKSLINWCGIVGLDSLGSVPFENGSWRRNLDEWAAYMRQPHYQKIWVRGTQRALLYLYWDANHLATYFGGKLSNLAIAVSFLRERLAGTSCDPYIVVLGGVSASQIIEEISADAISNYISGFRRMRFGTYAQLEAQTQEYWELLRTTGVPIIPIAMVGWDTRPRQEIPVPWSHGAVANPDPTEFYELSTPSQFAGHLRNAKRYMKEHLVACEANTLLIYAWNECDEGGGLIRTIGDPQGAHLSAMADVLS